MRQLDAAMQGSNRGVPQRLHRLKTYPWGAIFSRNALRFEAENRNILQVRRGERTQGTPNRHGKDQKPLPHTRLGRWIAGGVLSLALALSPHTSRSMATLPRSPKERGIGHAGDRRTANPVR